MDFIVERYNVTVRLEPVFWSTDHALLEIMHSNGEAEINRDEARALAKMFLEWADAGQ